MVGNFLQLFSNTGWDFNRDIVRKYGDVVRISGLFGVSAGSPTFLSVEVPYEDIDRRHQDEQLYITDPRALHHICVKDQYAYEEASATLVYVFYP